MPLDIVRGYSEGFYELSQITSYLLTFDLFLARKRRETSVVLSNEQKDHPFDLFLTATVLPYTKKTMNYQYLKTLVKLYYQYQSKRQDPKMN